MRQVLAVIIAVLCCGVVPVRAADELTTAHSLPVPVVALHSLYASYAVLSVLDFQTTRMALRSSGFHEANPLMSPVAGHSAALLAVKGAAAASTIYLTQRLRPHHPAMAVTAIIAANVISGFVVMRNAMTISGRPTGIPAR
jgi:hypothetical protein